MVVGGVELRVVPDQQHVARAGDAGQARHRLAAGEPGALRQAPGLAAIRRAAQEHGAELVAHAHQQLSPAGFHDVVFHGPPQRQVNEARRRPPGVAVVIAHEAARPAGHRRVGAPHRQVLDGLQQPPVGQPREGVVGAAVAFVVPDAGLVAPGAPAVGRAPQTARSLQRIVPHQLVVLQIEEQQLAVRQDDKAGVVDAVDVAAGRLFDAMLAPSEAAVGRAHGGDAGWRLVMPAELAGMHLDPDHEQAAVVELHDRRRIVARMGAGRRRDLHVGDPASNDRVVAAAAFHQILPALRRSSASVRW